MGAAILAFLATKEGAAIVGAGALAIYHLFSGHKKTRRERIEQFFRDAFPAVEGLAKSEGWGKGASAKKWEAAVNMVKEAMQVAGLGDMTQSELAEGAAMMSRLALGAKK